jgi:hypothetical protein
VRLSRCGPLALSDLSPSTRAIAFTLALLVQSPPKMQRAGQHDVQSYPTAKLSQNTAIRFYVYSGVPVRIPAAVRTRVENALDYRSGDTVRGVRTDLDGDGIAEYLLVGSARACGTGGCSILILDGRTGTVRGKLFGQVLVIYRSTRPGTYAPLETYTHGSATAGELDRWRFNGTQYRTVSRRSLNSDSVDSLLAVWNRLSSIP